MFKKILFTLLIVGGASLSASGQKLALKTNALYWLAATPNLGVEYAVSKHSTFNVTVNYNPWTFGEDAKIQHFFVRPEYRYWFRESYSHFFLSTHLIGATFEVGGFSTPIKEIGRLTNQYYVGSALGAGIGLGYSFYLSKHINIETSVGAALMRVKYHTENIKSGKHSGDVIHYLPLPTEVSVSFVYLFNSRKR